MHQVILALGFGIVTSAILAIAAVGFTLQFGVTKIFNLAYGDIMTAGAFVAYVVNVTAGASIWLALLAGAAAAAVLSALINGAIYRPFQRRGSTFFSMVMVSLAVSVILVNVMQGWAGADFYVYNGAAELPVKIIGMEFTPRQLGIIGLAVASLLGVHLLLRHTRLGKAMRATASDAGLAQTCGIATDRVTNVAWLLSGALCGAAGVALAMSIATFDASTGGAFLLVVVSAAVFGSAGHPYGAIIGAVVIGVASELAAIVVPDLKDVVAFVILVIVLLVRPEGLLASGRSPVSS